MSGIPVSVLIRHSTHEEVVCGGTLTQSRCGRDVRLTQGWVGLCGSGRTSLFRCPTVTLSRDLKGSQLLEGWLCDVNLFFNW